MQDVDYQLLRQNPQNKSGETRGRKSEKIMLTRSCLEYFIARKNRSVFEVYRKALQLVADRKTFLEQRNYARLGAPEMTKALEESRTEIGKETKPHHYSNEHNLVYIVALGASKKKYMRDILEIDNEDSLRDNLTPLQIEVVKAIQERNTVYIEDGLSYKERKDKLNSYYNKKYANRVKEEIDRIEG